MFLCFQFIKSKGQRDFFSLFYMISLISLHYVLLNIIICKGIILACLKVREIDTISVVISNDVSKKDHLSLPYSHLGSNNFLRFMLFA